MSDSYHRGSRELQDRFDTRRLADRLQERLDENDELLDGYPARSGR